VSQGVWVHSLVDASPAAHPLYGAKNVVPKNRGAFFTFEKVGFATKKSSGAVEGFTSHEHESFFFAFSQDTNAQLFTDLAVFYTYIDEFTNAAARFEECSDEDADAHLSIFATQAKVDDLLNLLGLEVLGFVNP
jgi:hypothetical protein